MINLIADQNVSASIDHLAGAAAMLVLISEAMSFKVIQQNRLATLNGLPCIRTAAVGVFAAVGNAQSRLSIDEYIGRTRNCRAGAGVLTARTPVGVGRDMRSIAESRLRAHCEKTITRNVNCGETKCQ